MLRRTTDEAGRAVEGTDKAMEEADRAVEGTDKAMEEADRAVEGTDKAMEEAGRAARGVARKEEMVEVGEAAVKGVDPTEAQDVQPTSG